jgi:hypothetical protein
MELLKQEEVQARYEEAKKLGLSPCMWFPPIWGKEDDEAKEWRLVEGELKTPDGSIVKGKVLPSNSADDERALFPKIPKPEDKGDYDRFFKELYARWERDGAQQSPELPPEDKKWPHPFSDFSHVDDSEFKNDHLKKIETAFGKDDNAVVQLKRLVGPESLGMKRLGAVFEWVLYRTSELMKEINDALNMQTRAGEADYRVEAVRVTYQNAWKNYIAFLKDLDDHEPEKHSKDQNTLDPTSKGSPSGYGRALKWACIDPVIYKGFIVGVRVIIHWNPHSSSNGIPIKHPPIT